MSKIGRLSVAFLFLAAFPLGCSETPSSPPKGTGGAGGGTGGSSATGGSAGSSNAGGSSGSGGSSNTGGTGGSSNAGGSSGAGGDATGGSSATGGGGGKGGSSDATGGAGGDATGGAGGLSTGGGGGTSLRDGGSDAIGGKPGDAQDGSVGDALSGDDGGSVEAGGTCTDNTQNNDETDVDCGGGTCGKCGSGMKCGADSDCRTGTCTAGKCLDAFAPTATVTQNGNMWRITLGTVIFEVDQSSAGKVYTFSIDGTDVVAKNIAATGSAFWTSPQNEWYTNGQTWPPANEMDTSAYTPTSKDNILTMTGPAWGGGLSIVKRYWGNVDHQAVTLEYTIKNGTSAAVKKAPWEITRVYAGGLSFFPNADAWIKQGDASFSIAPVTTSQGAVWFNDNAASYTTSVKGAADGLEGWAAHIACGTGLKRTCATGASSPILIKQWTDTPASNETVNPSEREVEIYVDQSNTYEEFEQQGLYQSIPAGGSLVWTMHWLLRYLPSTLPPTVGSTALLTWVRGQLL